LTGFADKTVLSLIHISRYFSAASKSRHLFAGIGWAKVKNDKTFFNPSPSSQTVEEIVKNSTPEELRRRNRQQLLALGASDQAATDFFDHPDYTPRDETIIATALGTVNVNPELFLKAACQARTRLDTFFYRSSASLAATYRQSRVPLQDYRMVEGVLCLLDGNGSLIVPLSLDYLQWTESVSNVMEKFVDLSQRGPEIKGVLLWTDGQLSERAQTELTQRQIAVESSVKTAE
jgi:hypothetical protein